MKKKITIGSRGSKLALIYAKKVKEALLYFSENIDEQNIAIKSISTKGDTILDKRLSDLGGKGLFSKNIEEELINKKIEEYDELIKDEKINVNKKNCHFRDTFVIKNYSSMTF